MGSRDFSSLLPLGGLLQPAPAVTLLLPKRVNKLAGPTFEKGTWGRAPEIFCESHCPQDPQVQFAHWVENGCLCQGAAARGQLQVTAKLAQFYRSPAPAASRGVAELERGVGGIWTFERSSKCPPPCKPFRRLRNGLFPSFLPSEKMAQSRAGALGTWLRCDLQL